MPSQSHELPSLLSDTHAHYPQRTLLTVKTSKYKGKSCTPHSRAIRSTPLPPLSSSANHWLRPAPDPPPDTIAEQTHNPHRCLLLCITSRNKGQITLLLSPPPHPQRHISRQNIQPTHRRETNATCFIAPSCTVTDTPVPPGRLARLLMLADTSQSENLPTKPSSRPRPTPIEPFQWRRGGEDECGRKTPSLGEERHTHLVHLSRLISAVDNRHSLGLSCPIFPEIAGINLTGDPPHSPLHKQDNIGE